MNRRQLIFIILLNALISLVVALAVVWAVEARRPDPETLAIAATPVVPMATLPAIAQSTEPLLPTASSVDATNDTAANDTAADVNAAPIDAAPTATLDPNNQQIYTIQSGDSLSAVATRFGTTVNAIMQANELADANVVYIGQRLIIPVGTNSNGSAPSPATAEPPTAPPLVVGEGILIRSIDRPGELPGEAIQIINDSNAVVRLTGWQLEREGGPTYTFGERSIFPGSNLWLHTANGDDTSVALYWDQTEALWPTGSVARLLDTEGNLIYSYTVP
ncbi:MAG: LysM peptidoglycan-binding domain-containing protein [Caldilineaceae bacterium]|nr:LysM peptidoglycan-binding domain-containing protein [Caldilineaceae bacterium]